jgi:N6-L-threonylcarbamoyladenine synthase
MLELGYPGGPAVEKFSKLGDKNYFKLPQPIINKAGCNLSFAGLKTAVLRESKKIKDDKKLKYNLAASFQNTVNKVLYKKTKIAMQKFRDKTKKQNFDLIVAGGVAANKSIRKNLEKLSIEEKCNVIYPDLRLSAKSRWPLDSKAPYMKGPGLKL